MARGSAPSTSPSPPVFEKGAASAVTKTTSVTFVRAAGGEAGGCCGASGAGVEAAAAFSTTSSESSSKVANEAVAGLATLGGAPPRTHDSSASTSSALAPSMESECAEAEAAATEGV